MFIYKFLFDFIKKSFLKKYFIFSFYSIKNLLSRYLSLYICFIDIIKLKINKRINKNKNTKIILYYDLANSPSTYGDFSYVIFLARFLGDNFENKIYLKIVYGLYRKDWERIGTKKNKEKFAKELYSLSRKLSNNLYKSEFILSQDLQKDLILEKNNFIIFRYRLSKRKRLYKHFFNYLNLLYLFSKKNKGWLINSSELKNYIPKDFYKKKYSTLSLRLNNQWGLVRNTSEEQLLELLNSFFRVNKNKLIILSDEIAKNHFKKVILNTEFSNKVIFAKDFTKSFIEDLAILFKSKAHYQQKANGIHAFVQFSNTPYLIHGLVTAEKTFLKNNLCLWALNNQIFLKKTNFNSFLKDFYKYDLS